VGSLEICPNNPQPRSAALCQKLTDDGAVPL